MEFKDLCNFFDVVKGKTGLNEKAKVFHEFFMTCRAKIARESIFSLLRLMCPEKDRERGSYNMKEAKIARVLIKLLALPNGNDKNVLSKSYLMSSKANDFGDVVYSVIRKYLSQCKTILKVDELNDSLDNLSKRSNDAEAEDILIKLFKKCSPEDSRWIIRIILKDLKLGISTNRMLNCYHRDALSYFDSNINLRKVSEVLYDPNVNAHELEIEIFQAFRPMLSKRVDAEVFKNSFTDNILYYVENKFDGERFQLHMENGTFKYFSRNGFDYTSTYGSTYEDGIFTPKLKNLFHPTVKKIILDGEMMLWNKQTNKYGSKGIELDVKKLNQMGKYQPCFCVYDMILLNNKVLTNRCLKDRVNLLHQIFQDFIPGTIVLSEIKCVNSQQEIIDQLNLAVDQEEEGIIVKNPDSVYKYSDRNSGWYKMKLEYFEDTMNDLDLIVMGGQFASSTSDQLNSFIIGVHSGVTDDGKPIFLSLGKVSSGLKDVELDMLNEKLKKDGKVFQNQHSTCLVFGREVPNYYIEPEHSIVFVVRATELIRTTDSSYRTSYTLRFPRVIKVRTDKPVDECLTINELLELTNKNQSVIKLNKRNIRLEEILEIKTRPRKKRIVEVLQFDDTSQVSDLFEGYLFHVLNGTEENPRDKIEDVIKKAGGKTLFKVDETVDIVLVGVYNTKAKELSSKRRHFDVIDSKWLYRVLQDGNLLAYETEEIYCLGYNIKNCLNDEVDRYGDSYVNDTTIASLKHSFDILTNLKEEPCFTQFVIIPGKSFEKYVAYFDKYDIIGDTNSDVIYESLEDELEFRYFYGTVCEHICGQTNLVIVNSNEERINYLQNYLRTIGRCDIEIRDKKIIYG